MAAKPAPSDILDDDVFELTDIVESSSVSASKGGSKKGSKDGAMAGGIAADLNDADVDFDKELEDLFSDAGLESDAAPAASPRKKPVKISDSSLNGGGDEEADFDGALKEIATQAETDALFDAAPPTSKAKSKKAPVSELDDFNIDISGLDEELGFATPPKKPKPQKAPTIELGEEEEDLFKDLGLEDFAQEAKAPTAKDTDEEEDDLFKDLDMTELGDELDAALGEAKKKPDPDLGGLDEELDLFSPEKDQKRPAKPAQPSGRDINASDDIDISGLDELISGLDLPETGDPLDAELKPAPPLTGKKPLPGLDEDAEAMAVDVEIGDSADEDLEAMLKFASEDAEEPVDKVQMKNELDAALDEPLELNDVALDGLGDELKAGGSGAALDATVLTGEVETGQEGMEGLEEQDDLLSDIEAALGFDLEEAEAALSAAAAAKELSRKSSMLDEEMDQSSIDAALSGEPLDAHPSHADDELLRRLDELEKKISEVKTGAPLAEEQDADAHLDAQIEQALDRKWDQAAATWSASLENKLGQLLEQRLAAESAAVADQVAERMEASVQRKVIEEIEARLENALSPGSDFAARLAEALDEPMQRAAQTRLEALGADFVAKTDLASALEGLKQDLGKEISKTAAEAAAKIIREEIAALAGDLL
jgi:hypothetical protein